MSEVGRHLPLPDNVPSDGRTHDVNQQMLAEQYRRGLRVGGFRRIQATTLDFLLGSK